MGISHARVSQIERGEIHNLETMRAYAEALGAACTASKWTPMRWSWWPESVIQPRR
ncbi:hypothetical protein [Streptomyces sp. NPDC001816]|uniref:hypothetical protein n=1 Tax=Streptomyces sp. NPDC001816 TaxID=3364612 RepID=UPI0036ACF6D1